DAGLVVTALVGEVAAGARLQALPARGGALPEAAGHAGHRRLAEPERIAAVAPSVGALTAVVGGGAADLAGVKAVVALGADPDGGIGAGHEDAEAGAAVVVAMAELVERTAAGEELAEGGAPQPGAGAGIGSA